ncbi:MAG: GAF domain-containing protein [Anaerolineales bacterium]
MIPRIALFYSRIRMQIRRIGFATKMALMSLFTVFILSLVLLLLSRVITVPITFYLISIILMVVLIPLVILFIARRALNPLVKVTDLIEHISRGEWGHRVEVHSEDEFGKLSHSLNEMLDELQNTYRALEDRVRDRTQLIRSASEVARNAVSIRDFNRLLIEVVNLISRRFGYYHVGAFLLDELGENVVLRAASSEGGQRMLNRGHSLTVGRVGIVGYVAGSGKPRIASDVGVDSHFFANPDLPHTRSEMALPMLAGDKLVGVLDVQSTQANAFSDDDVLILQTIADQLAVLVENSQLLQDQVKFSYTLHRIIEIYNRLSSEIVGRENGSGQRQSSDRRRAHQHDHPFGLRIAEVIENLVFATGQDAEALHRVLHDIGRCLVKAVDGLASLEIDVRILGRTERPGFRRARRHF